MRTSTSFRLLAMSLTIVSLSALTACGDKPAPAPTAAPAPAPTAPAAAPAPAPAPAAEAPAAAPTVTKADPHALMTSKGCAACHKVDTKLVGPAYQDVAKKYTGKPEAKAYLAKKIIDGGAGVWGPVMMPPNKGRISDEEVGIMVDWILAGAK